MTTTKMTKSRIEFRDLVHEGIRIQLRGHDVAGTAQRLLKHCSSLEEAHLLARAAEVHARWLRRESSLGKVQWTA